MIAACSENLALSGPSTMIVCGHGAAGSQSDILSFSEMLQDVRQTVVKWKLAGASAREVMNRKPTAPHDAK